MSRDYDHAPVRGEGIQHPLWPLNNRDNEEFSFTCSKDMEAKKLKK